jgi:hypothetical protein
MALAMFSISDKVLGSHIPNRHPFPAHLVKRQSTGRTTPLVKGMFNDSSSTAFKRLTPFSCQLSKAKLLFRQSNSSQLKMQPLAMFSLSRTYKEISCKYFSRMLLAIWD